MLSLVAGPYDIVPADPLEAAVRVAVGPYGQWIEGRGMFFLSAAGSTHVGDLYLLQLDGRAVRIGHPQRPDMSVMGWSPSDGRVCFAGLSGWWKSAVPTIPVETLQSSVVPGPFGVLPDRVIAASTNKILSGPWNLGAWLTLEEHRFPFTGTPFLSYAGCVGGSERWWVTEHLAGGVYLYDSGTRMEVVPARTSLGQGFILSGYSLKHDLFFAVRTDTSRTPNVDQLYVYAHEPVAATISAPVFAPAPRRGGRSRLSVQVLGDQGEPCVGRNVQFTVSTGSLALAVVATDATGTATTDYVAPNAAVSGQTATATLVA